MAATREVVKRLDDFDRKISITSTNTEGGTGWTRAAAGTGTPTIASVDGSTTGEIKVTITNDSNSQYIALHQGDDGVYDIDNIHQTTFVAKVAGVDSVSNIVFGMASDLNATADSVTNMAWFRIQGSASTSAVVVETDDGTLDLDDKSTGQTLSSTFKRFTIDFQDKNDVKFYIDGNRVASSTTFDMGEATGSLQPYVFVEKASGTGVPSITLDKWEIVYKR